MWLWLAKVINPDYFADDLRGAMKDRYQFLYGYSLSEDEIDQILWMKENSQSPAYSRLFTR